MSRGPPSPRRPYGEGRFGVERVPRNTWPCLGGLPSVTTQAFSASTSYSIREPTAILSNWTRGGYVPFMIHSTRSGISMFITRKEETFQKGGTKSLRILKMKVAHSTRPRNGKSPGGPVPSGPPDTSASCLQREHGGTWEKWLTSLQKNPRQSAERRKRGFPPPGRVGPQAELSRRQPEFKHEDVCQGAGTTSTQASPQKDQIPGE